MAVKVGINGFGRIGRNIFRTAIGDADIDFVAVNDITDTKTLAHLLKYDSVLGNLESEIAASENGIKVDGTIASSPPWASIHGSWNDAPTEPEVLRPFAKWLTERYGSKLIAVGVWNEPNCCGNLRSRSRARAASRNS